MKEKLIIKNFGPIKSVDLDLGRFNILIGEQATGKSTVAKVLAMCRYFSYIIGDEKEISDKDNILFIQGLEEWGLSEYLLHNSYISYDCDKYSFVFDCKIEGGTVNGKVTNIFYHTLTAKSPAFTELLEEFEEMKGGMNPLDILEMQWSPPINFLNRVGNVMDNPFYIPAERGLQSIFSLGKGTIKNTSDSLFNQLAKIDQIARSFKTDTSIEPLGITYRNDNGHGYVRKNNEDEFYSLYNAASGYQAAIPVVLLTKHYTDQKRKSKTLIIEEPELNLFPNAQKSLMHFLVKQINTNNSSLFINTHSPYILTSLNNLMYAYQVGQKNVEKTDKLISQKYWLNPNDISAYMMKSDGTCESILDEESLLQAEKIDEVSRIINEEFDNIMDIELGVDEGTE